MSGAGRLVRAGALPALAVALVSGVLAIQVDKGGLHYGPLRPADSCVARQVSSTTPGIEGLTEQLVLIGLDAAACQLGVSREEFALQLTQPSSLTDAQVEAFRTGLLTAVDSMKADGKLPRASELVREAVDASDLSGFRKAAIRAIPDSLIDRALTTDDIFRRTIQGLDLRALLVNFGNRKQLNAQVDAAVMKAVLARLSDILT